MGMRDDCKRMGGRYSSYAAKRRLEPSCLGAAARRQLPTVDESHMGNVMAAKQW